MECAHVRIIHIQNGEDIEGTHTRTAKIFLNGSEIPGIVGYKIDAGLDYVRGGVVQRITIEVFAEVEIVWVKK